MSTNNIFRSDLPFVNHVVQNAMVSFPKEAIIATLRDYFSKDSYYHCSMDPWGFQNTVDQTDLPLGTGLDDNISTRLFVGENYRKDGIFYPAVLIKHGGGRAVPISFNNEEATVSWEIVSFTDGYGNISFYRRPKSFVFAGAYEGSIVIDIMTRSLHTRDELLQEVLMCLNAVTIKRLQRVGVAIKQNPSFAATSETDDRNDKLFRQTITLEIRTEWRREIPVNNVVEVINFSVEFGRVDEPDAPIAQNLTIDTLVTVLDIMAGLPATPQA